MLVSKSIPTPNFAISAKNHPKIHQTIPDKSHKSTMFLKSKYVKSVFFVSKFTPATQNKKHTITTTRIFEHKNAHDPHKTSKLEFKNTMLHPNFPQISKMSLQSVEFSTWCCFPIKNPLYNLMKLMIIIIFRSRSTHIKLVVPISFPSYSGQYNPHYIHIIYIYISPSYTHDIPTQWYIRNVNPCLIKHCLWIVVVQWNSLEDESSKVDINVGKTMS